jgi:hypothetical protein
MLKVPSPPMPVRIGSVRSAQNGAALGYDSGNIAKLQFAVSVFDYALKTIFDPHYLHPTFQNGLFGYSPYNSVNPGAIAASAQNSYPGYFVHL